MTDIKIGESVKPTIDYDLFGLNVNGIKGVVVSYSNSNEKYLIYFEENGEWAELSLEDLKRVSPGRVTKKNKEFLSRVKTMTCSY